MTRIRFHTGLRHRWTACSSTPTFSFPSAYRPNAGLFQLWKCEDVTLCSSVYALEEAKINLEEDDQRTRLHRLAESVHLFEAFGQELPEGILLPGKDKPIMLAAIGAHSTHLLTGDLRHFGPYLGKRIAGILVTMPGDYLRSR